MFIVSSGRGWERAIEDGGGGRWGVRGGGWGGGGSSVSDLEHAVSLVWSLDMHRYTIKCLPEEEIIIRKLFT